MPCRTDAGLAPRRTAFHPAVGPGGWSAGWLASAPAAPSRDTGIVPPTACLCGRPQPYAACCGRFHGGEPAPTAELLMRSRYSAFALGDDVYLLETWHPSTRPARLSLDPAQHWIGLTVLGSTRGGLSVL